MIWLTACTIWNLTKLYNSNNNEYYDLIDFRTDINPE